MSQKYSLAICGASGAAFGVAILKRLIEKDSITHVALMVSATGKRCLHDETRLGPEDLTALSPKISLRSDQNVGADIASGSYRTLGMVIIPCSMSTVAKLAGEQYCSTFSYLYGIETVRLRYFSVFGPRQPVGEFGGVIPALFNALRARRSPIIYGDGMQIRDWLYVRDHCRAIERVLQAGEPGQAYNIGGWNEKPNLEVV